MYSLHNCSFCEKMSMKSVHELKEYKKHTNCNKKMIYKYLKINGTTFGKVYFELEKMNN